MNTIFTLNYSPANIATRKPAFKNLKMFLHSVLGLFAAQDDPAALRYMLIKNGESVD
jgi:hypothetical protein